MNNTDGIIDIDEVDLRFCQINILFLEVPCKEYDFYNCKRVYRLEKLSAIVVKITLITAYQVRGFLRQCIDKEYDFAMHLHFQIVMKGDR
jgi:hypothetical protein